MVDGQANDNGRSNVETHDAPKTKTFGQRWKALPTFGKVILGVFATVIVIAAFWGFNGKPPADTAQQASVPPGSAAQAPSSPLVVRRPIGPTPEQRAAQEKQFADFRDRCEHQAEIRRNYGLNVQPQLSGGPGQLSTCHVDGGIIESGRLE